MQGCKHTRLDGGDQFLHALVNGRLFLLIERDLKGPSPRCNLLDRELQISRGSARFSHPRGPARERETGEGTAVVELSTHRKRRLY